jgi:MFS family permease
MWLILELTNSPLLLGVSGVFMSVPFLITSLYGGALADRMDRVKLLVITQAIVTVLAPVPGILAALGVIKVWHLYLLSFLTWTVSAFDAPARQALIPSLVPRSDLMSAIALTSVVRRGTALVGPMIGGFALTLVGVAGAFFTYAIFDVLVLLTLFYMRAPSGPVERRGTPMARSIFEGFRSIRSSPVILGILGIEAVNTLFVTYQQLMPVFARDVLRVGPAGLGFLYASPGVGALIGSGLLLLLGDVRQKGRLFVVATFLQPIVIILFALSPWMAASMLMLALSGILDVLGGTVRNAMLQLSTRDQMRGRVMGMNMMVHRGLGPLSGLQAGAAATWIGAPFAVAAGATLFVGYAIFMVVRFPELRHYREEEAQGPSARQVAIDL